ncbi:MAG: glycosyltransferase [bacterium]|nr:glycosyltransferase [bacterium]
MKKNILFLTELDLRDSLGIKKKYLAQRKAFSEKYQVISFYCENNSIKKNDEIIYSYLFFMPKFMKKIIFYRLVFNDIMFIKIDVAYLRYTGSMPWFVWFLKKINKIIPKIILEFPDYPYGKSYITLKAKCALFVDKIYRKFLKKYVRIIFYCGNDGILEIWGIPAIKLNNGLCMNTLDMNTLDISNERLAELNFIAVAALDFWHGYDRFLLAMSEYYLKKCGSDPEIKFHIVGDGRDYHKLLELTTNLNLQDKVIFYGKKDGEDLKRVFRKAEIAVSSLALFRIEFMDATPNKTAEYCLKGLPIILAYNDARFLDADFVFKVNNDESLINLFDIIDWYFSNHFDAIKIRKYALKNLGWDQQFQKVFEEIDS